MIDTNAASEPPLDHIIDSVDIGDEAVKRGLMTDAEARIDNS